MGSHGLGHDGGTRKLGRERCEGDRRGRSLSFEASPLEEANWISEKTKERDCVVGARLHLETTGETSMMTQSPWKLLVDVVSKSFHGPQGLPRL